MMRDHKQFEVYKDIVKKASFLARTSNEGEVLKLYEEGLVLSNEAQDAPFIEFFQGEIKSLNGDNTQAHEHFKKAVELENDNILLMNALGASFSNIGEHEKGLEVLDKALNIAPEDEELLHSKASILSHLKKYDEALDILDQTLHKDPANYLFLATKGAVLASVGYNESALSYINEALKIMPNYLNALIDKGNVLVRLTQYPEAMDIFDTILGKKHDNYDALYGKGFALMRIGRLEDALDYFNRSLMVDPDSFDALREKGFTLNNLRRYTEASASFDAALKINNKDVLALRFKAVAHLHLGHAPSEIMACLEKALEIEPNNPETLRDMGLMQVNIGQGLKGVEYFNRSIEAEPKTVHSIGEFWIIKGIKGFLPFRINMGTELGSFKIRGSNPEEFATIRLCDVFNEAANHDLRIIGTPVNQAWPGPLEVMDDDRGCLVYSSFSLTMKVSKKEDYSDQMTILNKAIEFINRFIEVYRWCVDEPYFTKLTAHSPLLHFTDLPRMPLKKITMLFQMGPAPGFARKPWIFKEKLDRIQSLLNSGDEIPIEHELFLDARNASISNNPRTALFLACVAIETAIDNHLSKKAPSRYNYNDAEGFYEFDSKKARDILFKYGDYHQAICGRSLSTEEELLEALDYLKVIRNNIAHAGKLHYNRQKSNYYSDRNLTPKDDLLYIPKEFVEDLLGKTRKILDWLTACS